MRQSSSRTSYTVCALHLISPFNPSPPLHLSYPSPALPSSPSLPSPPSLLPFLSSSPLLSFPPAPPHHFSCPSIPSPPLSSPFLLAVGYLAGFTLSLCLFTALMPFVMRRSSAALINLSLLTSDFYGLLFGLFLFKYTVSCVE